MTNIFDETAKVFPHPIQQFVFFDKYSKFNWSLGRREGWPEVVQRVTGHLRWLSKGLLSDDEYQGIHDAIYGAQVAPSMRLMRTAGEAARRIDLLGYNCAYTPINCVDAIVELFWLSMCGVGVGYSVEHRYVSELPPIGKKKKGKVETRVIEDSAEGWRDAFRLGLETWWDGGDVKFDYSEIRPAGTPLRTKGGTSSGPGVLRDLLDYSKKLIQGRTNDKLSTVDVFDLCTSVGSCAVSGGSRRSAQICLFDKDDEGMLSAKTNGFWETHPNRANANISVVIESGLERDDFERLVRRTIENETGEPGIVSRYAMQKSKPGWRKDMPEVGLNPCAEVMLNPVSKDGEYGGEVCNLSSVHIRPTDTLSTLAKKVKWATIIGTIQSMADTMPGLREAWRDIQKEERLLGVSLVGATDNKEVALNQDTIRYLRDYATQVNVQYAKKLGINRAAAVTCVKPAGNSSVLYDTARGINARYSPYYIRRVRLNTNSPMYKVFQQSGYPVENIDNDMAVASFYIESPEGALIIKDMSALQQLENWKLYKTKYTHHNPSVTIEYEADEVDGIIDWLYDNQGIISGLSFLPKSDMVYEHAPYEEITEKEYKKAIKSLPAIDFSLLETIEAEDNMHYDLECAGGVCDLT